LESAFREKMKTIVILIKKSKVRQRSI